MKAYDDGADIINLSLSGPPWAPSSLGSIASQLVNEGVFVSIASGNSRISGPFQLNSEAAEPDILAVAASEPFIHAGIYISGGGQPAQLTSWGPTYDLTLKPDISAPGVSSLAQTIVELDDLVDSHVFARPIFSAQVLVTAIS